ncbi:MAG: sulfatase-like hydrolase/transferase [Luteolibacter sp.]
MNAGRYVLSQILDLVHWQTLSRLVAKYEASSRHRHFGFRQQFTCMVFAQLTSRDGLRDIAACLNARPEALYHLGFSENNAKPVTLNETGERAPAILTAYYAGQETGTAAAEMLFGRTNPSGKLSISWPRSAGHLPSYYSQNGSAQVFDYLDSPRSALYPFGFGLSYTTYGYGKPALSKRRIAAGESVDVTFTVTNKGDREGTEIAQVYVSGKGFELARPGLELKGFARVALKPGESKPVTVTLDADDLAFHGIDLVRSLKSGVFEVRVGGSSANLSAPVMLQSVADGPKEKQAASKSSGSTINDLQLAATGGAATSNGKQPNILFIAVDDLRPELGCYGSKVISPHMDRLAATGMRFDRAYCQQAVCGASRLSIMGGLYPVNTGEQNYHVTGWRRRHPDLLTLNRHLNANGYETIGLGKIYHDHIGVPEADLPNWSQWIDIGGGEYALPENIELAKQAMAKATLRRNQPPPEGPTTEAADVDDDRYKDGKRAAKAVEILRGRAAAGGKPFFLAVGFTKPHLPFAVPQKYWNLYKREDFSMPSNKGIPPGYPKAAANPDAGEMRRYTDYVGRGPGDFPDEMNLRLLHGYAAATSYADACVGRVLVALEETGLAKNTIVVLWGDHGWKLGDHSSWCKHTNFECDTRVPLIVRDPRVAGGKSTQSLVELIDLYPTLCDLADIPVPAHCQGRSFSRLLADPTAGHRDDAYSSYPAGNGMGHSLRFGIYRYTEWHDNDTGAVNARVLTDLVADPGEVTNVLKNPTLAETVRQASSRLNERIGKARSGKP